MKKTPSLPSRARLAALALALLLAAIPADSDDRNLVRTSGSEPYVFVLLDNTYSMTLDLQGVRAPLLDDDPTSRVYLAKQAMNTVVQRSSGVRFGFATFPNFSGLRVLQKECGGACIGSAFTGRIDDDDLTGSAWCQGWEGNGDDADDAYQGYSVLMPTTTSAEGLELGDMIPFDWARFNKPRIRQRLAPNLLLGEADPDFGIARYFSDSPGDPAAPDALPLLDERARPFFAWGNTPLAGALDSFRLWYQDWEPLALENDPLFAAGCRDVFNILVTDGLETCGGDPVASARDLFETEDIPTFVVGFAVDNPQLDAIAVAGGTDSDPEDPNLAHYPAGDQEALIDALTDILEVTQSRSRTFASAAVPSVQSEAGRQIFLSSFSPVSEVSVWPGRLDAYIRPVPFAETPSGGRVPDRRDSARCSPDVTDACRAWSADEEILTQSPTELDILADDLKIGFDPGQRRVFYAPQRQSESVPSQRLLFLPPDNEASRLDLYGPAGMGLDPDSPEFESDGTQVIERTLVQKQAVIDDPVTTAPVEIDYVLGDIFHSDPQVVTAPDNLRYFSADLKGRVEPCGQRIDGGEDLHPPYPCFAQARRYRRRVLLAGSNDGQLHAFDAGTPEKIPGPGGQFEVEYNNGTGKEIFSFVPREALPAVRRLAELDGQEFIVDGTITIDDVVIDPSHDGVPDSDLRQWRTVVLGGLREGGRSYYALDITQPDLLDSDGVPTANSYVPSCSEGVAGCRLDSPLPGLGPYPNLPYPMLLWEIGDTWDEDGNGAPDLGFTWSRPNVGRIRIDMPGNEITEKYVAVFAGGMDPEFKRNPVDELGQPNPRSGNYLYMVDIETGEIIYKRRLDVIGGEVVQAMAPSEPAAVDSDFDTYLDTIYVGTTTGHLFKVDISSPQPITNNVRVDDYSTPDPQTGEPPLERRVSRIVAEEWEPFPIFSTGGRPIYYPPSVVFVAELGAYALAFGTGDREDLWDVTGQDGRFYLFLDGGFTADTPNLPFDESKLEPISVDGEPSGVNFLLDRGFDPTQSEPTNPGWFLQLAVEERVVNKSFSLSGVVFFSSYIPEPLGGAVSCGSSGESHLFVVAAGNANGLLTGLGGGEDALRYRVVADFVTSPFVEASYGDSGPPDDPTEPPAPGEDPCQGMDQVTETIQSLFPPNCSFANYTVNIKTIRSDSGIECVAPVPLCIVERNWKEF